MRKIYISLSEEIMTYEYFIYFCFKINSKSKIIIDVSKFRGTRIPENAVRTELVFV